MKLTIEINEDEIKRMVIDKIAHDLAWSLDSDIKNKILKDINWSKMTPFVQEAILKKAAEKFFS